MITNRFCNPYSGGFRAEFSLFQSIKLSSAKTALLLRMILICALVTRETRGKPGCTAKQNLTDASAALAGDQASFFPMQPFINILLSVTFKLMLVLSIKTWYRFNCSLSSKCTAWLLRNTRSPFCCQVSLEKIFKPWFNREFIILPRQEFTAAEKLHVGASLVCPSPW